MSVSRYNVVVLLALALCVAGAQAQGSARKRVPIKPVGIVDYRGELFLKGEGHSYETITEDRTETTTSKDVEWLFEEGVEGTVDGYVYHPNLLEWTLGGRLTKTQERTKISDDETETLYKAQGLLRAYNMSFLLLKEKPVSLQLYAGRDDNLRDRDVTGSRKVQTDRRGAQLTLKGKFPVTFLMEEYISSETSDLRLIDEHTKRYELTIQDRRNRDWQTDFSYERKNVGKTSIFTPTSPAETPLTQRFPEKIDELNLSNLWKFGPAKEKHSLSGSARVIRRRGFYESTTVSADQRLTLLHSKSLSTYYFGRYDTEKIGGVKERTLRAETGITKKFYDSLDVTLRGEASRRSSDMALEKRAGGFLDVAYRKKTPIGRYTSSLTLGREREEDISDTGEEAVRDESVTLTGLDWSALAGNKIILGSIVVTDATNTITYFETVDYRVRTTGDTVEIRRLLAGGIGDPETVLVDYITEVSPGLAFSTKTFRWNNRLALKKVPIEFYVDYESRDQRVISGEDIGTLEQERDILVGAELDYKGFTLALEHQDHDQDLSPPTTVNRVRADYRKAVGRRLSLSLGAHAERIRFLDTGHTFDIQSKAKISESVGANASLSVKLGRNALLRLSSDLTKISGRENTSTFRNRVSLEWQYRKLEFSLDAEYNIETQITDEQKTTRNSASVMFYLKRKF